MKNIVVFDLETTGLDRKKDFIIQFAGIKIDTETNKVVEEKNLYIQPSGSYTISISAYLAHGIKPEFLADKPHFEDVAQEIIDFFKDSDVLTFNGNGFDIPFLKQELERCGYGKDLDFTKMNCYDAFLEEKRRNGNTLGETYARYRGKTMEDAGLTAHDALSDVKATYSVFVAQQRNQPYGPEQMFGEDGVIKVMKFGNDEVPCFSMGKYARVSVQYVAEHFPDYIQWAISDTCNFSTATKVYLRQFIK